MRKALMLVLALVLLLPSALAVPVVTDVGGMPLAMVILTPAFLGFLILGCAFLLDPEEHGALRIFLMLMALCSQFLSRWFDIKVVAQYYMVDEIVEQIADGVFIYGAFFSVVVIYFLIYTFYKLTHIAAGNKKEKMLQ
uniref:Uncharacterized protein n=1 Tax=viral metagenome TaxID=1070528 RepID=A0A6M3IF24_9ZZZZ